MCVGILSVVLWLCCKCRVVMVFFVLGMVTIKVVYGMFVSVKCVVLIVNLYSMYVIGKWIMVVECVLCEYVEFEMEFI